MFMKYPVTQIPKDLYRKNTPMTDELAACGNKLFRSGAKFSSNWPSFLNKTVKAALCTKRTTLLNGKNPLRKMRWASRTSLMMDLRLLAKDIA
jgi:hypothetical protein